MNNKEARVRELELTKTLKPNYPDIKVHIDLINGTNKVNIVLFWNVISIKNNETVYKDSKTYRIESKEYDEFLNIKILNDFK